MSENGGAFGHSSLRIDMRQLRLLTHRIQGAFPVDLAQNPYLASQILDQDLLAVPRFPLFRICDTSATYTLTNTYTGSKDLLAAIPAIQMVKNGSDFAPSTATEWFLTLAETSPFYRLQHRVARLRPVARRAQRQRDAEYQRGPTRGSCGDLTPWPASDNGRLSNNFAGLDTHLDVYSGTLQPHLASGDYSGHHWSSNEAPADFSVSATFQLDDDANRVVCVFFRCSRLNKSLIFTLQWQ
ncbi:hypothetical protein F5B21DRAFT_507814 [Xylaria acuta]|nr:hypothetical protein F5B21DRAFT_507814 [Xylaria acuta]